MQISHLLTSFPDIQELLNALQKRDCVEVVIKLIDLKLKIDPSGENPSFDVRLQDVRKSLQKLHPYFIRIQKVIQKIEQIVLPLIAVVAETFVKEYLHNVR